MTLVQFVGPLVAVTLALVGWLTKRFVRPRIPVRVVQHRESLIGPLAPFALDFAFEGAADLDVLRINGKDIGIGLSFIPGETMTIHVDQEMEQDSPPFIHWPLQSMVLIDRGGRRIKVSNKIISKLNCSFKNMVM